MKKREEENKSNQIKSFYYYHRHRCYHECNKQRFHRLSTTTQFGNDEIQLQQQY